MTVALSLRLPRLPDWLTRQRPTPNLDEQSVSAKILAKNHINCFPDEHLRRLFVYRLQGQDSAAIFIASPKQTDLKGNSLVSDDIRELKEFLAHHKIGKNSPRFGFVAHADVVLTTTGTQLFRGYISISEARMVRYFSNTPIKDLKEKVYGCITAILDKAVQDRASINPQFNLAKLHLPQRITKIPTELGDRDFIP